MGTTRAIPVLIALTLMTLASCGDDDLTAGSAPTITEQSTPTPVGPSDGPEAPTPASGGSDLAQGWTRTEQLRNPFTLATNGTRVVILGEFGGPLDSAAFFMDDREHWAHADSSSFAVSVTADGGPGGFVAVGTEYDGRGGSTPVVSYSTTGQRWEEIDVSTLPSGTVASLDVVAGPEGYVITGLTNDVFSTRSRGSPPMGATGSRLTCRRSRVRWRWPRTNRAGWRSDSNLTASRRQRWFSARPTGATGHRSRPKRHHQHPRATRRRSNRSGSPPPTARGSRHMPGGTDPGCGFRAMAE